jgi:hypothetical protein
MQEWTIKSLFQLKTFEEYIKNNQDKTVKVGLTDKKDILDRFEIVKRITRKKLKMTLNYAICNHYNKNDKILLENFLDFYKNCLKFEFIKEILIISGSSQRKKGTNFLLSELANSNFKTETKLSLAVAYNPFLNDLDLEIEQQKLDKKLSTKLVQTVYFQLGDNTQKLIKGIKFLRQNYKNQKIIISILKPNEQKLASLRFRPWKGVFYSQKFLNNFEFAKQKTAELEQIAKSLKVGIIWS